MSIETNAENLDRATVKGFGDEWSRFDQSHMSDEEQSSLFEGYFRLFPWSQLPSHAVGFDLGCGSGRWARHVAPRVGMLHCIDASSDALLVAKRNLKAQSNCIFHNASVGRMPLSRRSMDFGYSLGVLHHVPDTLGGLRACVELLKPGAPFLLYLYYALDNRPLWFRATWLASDQIRKVISRLPMTPRYLISQAIAGTVYYPLARFSALVERLGLDPSGLPLTAYRARSFGTMRTDALDRFGTRLEKRFRREEVVELMAASGLTDIQLGDAPPFWCGVGFKAR